MHRLAIPRLPPVRSSAEINVARIRAPDAPIGCPMAVAPPWMFTFSCGNVEVDRFLLHTQQLRVHAAAKDLGGVTGEVAVLEWIRFRLAPTLDKARLAVLDADLRALRGAASAGNASAAADLAAQAGARLRRF